MRKLFAIAFIVVALMSGFSFVSIVMKEQAEKQTEQTDRQWADWCGLNDRNVSYLVEKVDNGWIITVGPWTSWAHNKFPMIFYEVTDYWLNETADVVFTVNGVDVQGLATINPGDSFSISIYLDNRYKEGTTSCVDVLYEVNGEKFFWDAKPPIPFRFRIGHHLHDSGG